MEQCHRCQKPIEQKDLVVATRYVLFRPYHRRCYADLIQESAFKTDFIILNSPQGRLSYGMAWAIIPILLIGLTIMAIVQPLLLILYSIPIALGIGTSIYYIRKYKKYRAILGPQPLPDEFQRAKGKAAKQPAFPSDKTTAVVCAHCEKQILKRGDIIVARSNARILPYHKECFVTKAHSSLFTDDIPLNGAAYTVSIAAIIVVFGILSIAAVYNVLTGFSSDGVHPLVILVFLIVAWLIVWPRWYAYRHYERKLPK